MSLTLVQELSLRKNRLTVLPNFLNAIKSLQVLLLLVVSVRANH